MFDVIYDHLEDRLDITGPINFKDCFDNYLAELDIEYRYAASIFRQIIYTMIEQHKAIKLETGIYEILKPNRKPKNE